MTHRTLALSNEVHFFCIAEELIYCGFQVAFFAASGRLTIQNDAPPEPQTSSLS
jgi:hypothetical protein